jgi:murein DD-endopeptidase MepM/ murein hydrolase activator NlpD
VPQKSTFAQSDTDTTRPVIQIENTLTTKKTIQNPLKNFELNQGFSILHPGIDLGAKIGEPVRAMRPGVVIQVEYESGGYGNTVLIEHEQGMTTRYAHLSKIMVKKGERVDLNTIIGLVGVSGRSTGPHLHLEVRVFGLLQDPLNYIAPTNQF